MPRATSAPRNFLSVLDLDPADLDRCLQISARMKADRSLGREAPTADVLGGRHVAMLFEKASLRTWTTFAIAVRELGGNVVALLPDVSLGRREAVADVARSLERWVDAVIVRTFSHRVLEEFAAAAPRLHVVNALTDDEHPCQALADALTIRDRLGALEGVRVAWVGDGSNVLVSLAELGKLLGYEVVAAGPEGYEARGVETVRDPREAVRGADVVVTDTWISMGQEHERVKRLHDLEPYRLDRTLLSLASPDAFVMHCLPAHPGEEITAEVLYGPESAIWDEAENRLHVQKALLALLLGA